MKSFKLYMDSLKGDKQLFETVFEESYKKGFFGYDMDKDDIRDAQFRWFKTFKKLLESKNYDSLVCVLLRSDNNRVTKEWFSRLTGVDISRKSVQFIEQCVREYCDMEYNRKTVVSEWKRYINMSPSEVEKLDESNNTVYFVDKLKKIKSINIEEADCTNLDWMYKHLRLLKKVKDTKHPLKNVSGEPTKKFNFLKLMGCNPDEI